MKIQNYKYNEESFEKEVYDLLKKRDVADKELTKQEKITQKDIKQLSLSYYKAYLNYMHYDNLHMGSFLAYLKHEYEKLKKATVSHFNDDIMLEKLNELINKTEQAFDFYYQLYNCLKVGEFELKEAIKSFEDQKFREDCGNMMSLHFLLSGLTQQDLRVHNIAENYREQVAFPLVEECLKVRNRGMNFETYAQRAEKIISENDLQK